MTNIKLNIANENSLLFEKVMEFINSLPKNREEIKVEIKEDSEKLSDDRKEAVNEFHKLLDECHANLNPEMKNKSYKEMKDEYFKEKYGLWK